MTVYAPGEQFGSRHRDYVDRLIPSSEPHLRSLVGGVGGPFQRGTPPHCVGSGSSQSGLHHDYSLAGALARWSICGAQGVSGEPDVHVQ